MKKRILITDTAPLYPPLWGGPKRIWNLYSSFSKELFDIVYVGLNCNMDKHKRYKFTRINENFTEIASSLPAHYYFWNTFEKIFLKNTSLDLFTYLRMHTDWQFKHILNSQMADVVICSHPWSSLCVDKNKQQFFIYDAHNCEFLLMKQILRKHILKNVILDRVRRIEADACRKSDLILACSKNEKEDLVKLYKADFDKVVIVSNGANISFVKDGDSRMRSREAMHFSDDDKVVIFIGAYYKPNIEAAQFIAARLSYVLSGFKFLIVGTVKDAFKDIQVPHNVNLLGYLSDKELDLALRASDIAINPMFEGSGVNIKMLDYMSYGLPIVTTECGARGIETSGKQPMLISSADDFAENIKKLSDDARLSERLAEDGRSLVAEHYDWKVISNKLQELILERIKHN